MPSIGKGVEEIRMWDDTDTYRVVYTAKLADAVYVLHAFQKKTQAAARSNILSRAMHNSRYDPNFAGLTRGFEMGRTYFSRRAVAEALHRKSPHGAAQ